MPENKTAPEFARKLNQLIHSRKKKQRQLAKETGISSTAVNRLCTIGMGSEDNICRILSHLGKKRRRMVEMMTDRRAELSSGAAREVWANFRYAFLDEGEYLNEVCPLPLQRAYACTHHGIALQKVVQLAEQHGIKGIQDLRDIDPWKFVDFVHAFEGAFGQEAKREILGKTCEEYPPVLLLEFTKEVDPAWYLKLKNCEGRLLFGLPHLVLGEYVFAEGGTIGAHRNTGGVEFLYSMQGTFELTYEGKVYGKLLDEHGAVFVFDAKHKHKITLRGATPGRLFFGRYYPKKRKVLPGRPRRRKPRD